MKRIIIVLLIFITTVINAAPADDFVITVKTDNQGGGTDTEFVIYINYTVTGQYNYNVDCNDDGIVETSAIVGNYTCSYPTAGTYTIRIIDNSGTGNGFPAFWTNPASVPIGEKILAVEQWGTGKWESMLNAFSGATNMAINATDTPDFSNVTSMKNMFRDAALADPDTSNWDTSSVTSMATMFSGATSANPDTSNWNTSSVTSMAAMFSGATSANPNTSSWNTSAVTSMIGMFSNATSANPDTSNWTTQAVTNMRFMFNGATSANPDTSSWDISGVTDMTSMFAGTILANPDTSNWDVSNVTNMSFMFSGVTLPTSSYDQMLIGFAAQNLQNGVNFHAGNSQYCSNAAQAARANIIANYNWNITDGGVCPEIFQDGFESTVVVFKTANARFAFDFSGMELLPDDETPKLIATGIDSDKQVNVKIYLRQFDGVLEIMQSQLLEVLDGEQVWSDDLWYEVSEQGLSEVKLW